jgi:starch-binding outer membrane protein, SusD/RagB family
MKRPLINLLFLSSLLPAASCKKFLSTLPDNRTVITTPALTSQLLTAAYPHSSYMLFCEAMSDNAEDKGNTELGVDPGTFAINIQAYAYQDEQATTGLDLPVTYFDSCYHAIAVANQALVYCNNADSANYTGQKGEALLCRAYAHFMLVTLFAKSYDPATASTDPGVPYVTTPETHVFQNYDRKTVAYDYQMIENDLVRGLALIDESTYGTAPKFHFTKQAAHAFASRFYLFKQNYAQVVAHSTAVFGSSDPATLIRDQTVYNTKQYPQLQIDYTADSINANILLQETASLYASFWYQYRYGYGQTLFNQIFNSGTPAGGSYDISTFGSTPQFYNFPKFNPQNNNYAVLPLLTMDEVLMNRAEANIRLHNYQAATDDLNAWVSKNVENHNANNQIVPYNPSVNNVSPASLVAHYGMSQDSAMIQAVLDFKRVTFMQEGLRWFDILRLKIPVHHTGLNINTTLTPNDPRRLLQLPLEAPSEGMPLNPR